MKLFTFDEICESQDFNHDDTFIKTKHIQKALERILDNTGDETETLVKSYLDIIRSELERIEEY